MKYAIKLNTTIPTVAYGLRRNTRVISVHGTKEKGEIYKKYVTRADASQIVNVLPQTLASKVKGVFISNIGPVAAHVHTEEGCVINLYLDADGAKTVFYEGNIEPIEEHRVTTGHQYFYAATKSLKAVEEFEAVAGDTWIMNTKQPHAVVSDGVWHDRWAVQIYLSTPFSEAIKHFNN